MKQKQNAKCKKCVLYNRLKSSLFTLLSIIKLEKAGAEWLEGH